LQPANRAQATSADNSTILFFRMVISFMY